MFARPGIAALGLDESGKLVRDLFSLDATQADLLGKELLEDKRVRRVFVIGATIYT